MKLCLTEQATEPRGDFASDEFSGPLATGCRDLLIWASGSDMRRGGRVVARAESYRVHELPGTSVVACRKSMSWTVVFGPKN